jgi:hypothetical protein
MPWNMFFCTLINIGPTSNLYSTVDSGSVFSWLFAPAYWRRFFHVNLYIYFNFLTLYYIYVMETDLLDLCGAEPLHTIPIPYRRT